jgi:hypothetical protein
MWRGVAVGETAGGAGIVVDAGTTAGAACTAAGGDFDFSLLNYQMTASNRARDGHCNDFLVGKEERLIDASKQILLRPTGQTQYRVDVGPSRTRWTWDCSYLEADFI